jgi:polyhydroxybutyrate depolymerase
LSDHYNPPLDSIAEAWAVLNECSTDSTFTTGDGVDVWNWSNCADSSEIVFYLTKDGGHSWPMGIAPRRRADQPSEVINANELMWDFFKTHPKQ